MVKIDIDIPKKGCKGCGFLCRSETMEVGMSPDDMFCNLFQEKYLGPAMSYKPLDECIEMRKNLSEDCMTKVRAVFDLPKIHCGTCGDTCNDLEDAEDCCASYQCTECSKFHDSLELARECKCEPVTIKEV